VDCQSELLRWKIFCRGGITSPRRGYSSARGGDAADEHCSGRRERLAARAVTDGAGGGGRDADEVFAGREGCARKRLTLSARSSGITPRRSGAQGGRKYS